MTWPAILYAVIAYISLASLCGCFLYEGGGDDSFGD